MSAWSRKVKEWLPALASVCALILTSVYAVSRKAHAAEGIREVGGLGATLSDAARLARANIVPAEAMEALAAQEAALESRMADVLEPSLVQAELVRSASRAGLVFRGILQVGAASPAGGQDTERGYPRYRVSVGGSYRQVAEYMQLCGEQRLPARVTVFRIRRASEGDDIAVDRLIADITVEAFMPRHPLTGIQGGK